MKFFELSLTTFFLLSFRTAAQSIGGGNTTATIIGGTESARVPGYVASGPGACGAQLIHPDIAVRTELKNTYC